MRILFAADRLSVRGGADWHLRQMVASAVDAGHPTTVAVGRVERDAPGIDGARVEVVRGLSRATGAAAGLGHLKELLEAADVVHVQNVMNPEALGRTAATGRSLVTVQDHRVFCPGMGKTLPDGRPCHNVPGDDVCAQCLPDRAYRRRLLSLTRRRREALKGVRLLALSRYMADELAAVGLGEALVLPPWVEVGPERREAGAAFLLGGRLVAHKDVRTAWKAWRAAATSMPLRVAGEGPLASSLHGATRLGWLPRHTLRRELGSARALLFPAFWQEPFGILGIEALASGTPVIVADVGGTREWSDAGCLRVPSGDISAMEDAVRRLAADEGLALALGGEGRAAVVARFSRRRLEPRLHEAWRDTARHANRERHSSVVPS